MKFFLRLFSVISTLGAYVFLAADPGETESLSDLADLGVSMLIIALALLWLSLLFKSASTQTYKSRRRKKLWPSESINPRAPTALGDRVSSTTQTDKSGTNAAKLEPAKMVVLSADPDEISQLELYGSRSRARQKRLSSIDWDR